MQLNLLQAGVWTRWLPSTPAALKGGQNPWFFSQKSFTIANLPNAVKQYCKHCYVAEEICLLPILWGKAGVVQPGEDFRDAPISFQPSSTLNKPTKKLEKDFFTTACIDRTRGNGFKWKGSRFKLYTRKKFFTTRVVRLCSCLHRDMDSPFLEVFKTRLSNPDEWQVSLPRAGGLDLGDL